MSNEHTALVLALGAGAGLGLWALLRDEPAADPAGAPPPAAPTPTVPAAPTAPPPCALRLDAQGLTADGTPIDIPTAVTRCHASGRADLVLADDAPSAAYADLAAAFGAAGILITQRRNARPRRGRAAARRRRRQLDGRNASARSDLAALVTLAAQLRADTTTRQGARGDAATRLARFVARHSGARVNDDATIDVEDNVMVSGTPGDMRKVAAWVERLARDTGRPVSATVETFDDPDDPDWAVCRIRGLGLESPR